MNTLRHVQVDDVQRQSAGLDENAASCSEHAQLLANFKQRIDAGEQPSIIFTALSNDPLAQELERERCVTTSQYEVQLLQSHEAEIGVETHATGQRGRRETVVGHAADVLQPTSSANICRCAQAHTHQVRCTTCSAVLLV